MALSYGPKPAPEHYTTVPTEAFGWWSKEAKEQYWRPTVEALRGPWARQAPRLKAPRGWVRITCPPHLYERKLSKVRSGTARWDSTRLGQLRCVRCGHHKGSKIRREVTPRAWAPCDGPHELALPHTAHNRSDVVRCVRCLMEFGPLSGTAPTPVSTVPAWNVGISPWPKPRMETRARGRPMSVAPVGAT